MHEYWHVILESLVDTVKVLPILFVVYYLIELIEYKNANKMHKSKILKGKASPVAGSVLGCVPQCGFSVVSTDLFSKGKLSVGALIAVYIATSDEALPLMIANPKSFLWMLALIGVKLVFAIVIGYLSIGLFKVFFKRSEEKLSTEHSEHKNKKEKHDEHHDEHVDEEELELDHGGCCHHHVETKSFDWVHPVLHCVKISAFILVINILFGFITHIWVGEDKLIAFLNAGKFAQPLLAVIIGLIPNCASSVVLTELFLLNGLSFGALVAGLCVNAGLGLIMLFKQNKNWKVNLFIVCMLIIPSLILGYSLIWL